MKQKKTIKDFATNYDIKINESLFDIGNLKQKDFFNVGLEGLYKYPELVGTESEKEKYKKIMEIKEQVIMFYDYVEYFNILDDYNRLSLVIENNGISFDVDISIKIYIPKGRLLLKNDITIPSQNIIENINNYIEHFLKQEKVHHIEDYPDYNDNIDLDVNIPNLSYLNREFQEEKYKKDMKKYNSKISSRFLFDYYSSHDYDILKFHQNYLKHNTKNFLPCFLLFKEEVKEIKYEITSKHNSKMIKDTLKL
ncbi:hypothetical protein [Halocella sp. SP3-1]|uniref:hypothetical protein n=1 Tax=Halocella sp. SP3-1 TaxID=2382161 RepID=UPI000F75D6B8|nr:hypothetical protein [Halocella sp. SP3-1]AZO95114.1 hypothetical protein D7D81_11240 [Halocella sp. SP3-1]